MKNSIKILLLLTIPTLMLYSCMERQTFAKEDNLSDFFQKKEVTIAVTDSGLGGLSIMADAVERMRESKMFRKINFIFFNALFSNEGGYNSLKTQKEKVLIFNSALMSLEKNFSPDMILIGCNTLSVLYEDTEFSRLTKIPVIGIVDSGVKLIAQSLKAHPESHVILFATQTTISEESHKDKLVAKGFLPERIIAQACPELARYIERGYNSDETEMLIYAYVDEALQKVRNHRSALYVSLNCTHYDYSLELWKKAFQSHGVEPLAFLNPNSDMVVFLFQPPRQNRFKSTEISTQAVSMVKINKETMDSIGAWLMDISPQTADGLKDYDLQENLFEWKKYITTQR